MQKVKIITTSGCDLTFEETERLGVTMIPDWVIFGETQYRNNIDILPEAFYEKIASEENLPSSAHPSPAQFTETFEGVKDWDEAICIVVSSQMAGAYNTATFTAEQVMEDGIKTKIYIFDSLQISLGMGILVLEAARMAKEGACASEILEHVTALRSNIGLFFVMNTLDYARRGGRIGAITAVAADTLGVKPLLTFKDGIVSDLSLNRTLKSGIKAIYKKYVSLADDNPEVFIFHANNLRGAESLKAMLQEQFPELQPRIEWVGPVVGLYSGPGCVGMAFRKKEV